MRFCEADVCSLIRFPADSFSMLVLLVIGVLIVIKSRNEVLFLRFLGVVAISLARGSFIYHATGTYFGQLLDLLGMFLFAIYYLCINVQRLQVFSFKAITALYFATVILSMLVLALNQGIGIMLFGLQLAVALGLEIYLAFGGKKAASYNALIKAWLCFAVGYGFWVLDFKRILCVPENHILTGHGVWHVMSAFAIWYSYQYFRELDIQSAR